MKFVVFSLAIYRCTGVIQSGQHDQTTRRNKKHLCCGQGMNPGAPRAKGATTSHAVLFYKYTDVAKLSTSPPKAVGVPSPRSAAADAVGAFVNEQRALCANLGLLGRLLIGAEGVNGTLCCPGCTAGDGAECPLDTYIAAIPIPGIDWKRSTAPTASSFFSDLTVKHVNEIVATGRAEVETDPDTGDIVGGGTHLSPEEWHRSLGAPNTVVIDVRNTFEHAIGTFFTPSGTRAIEPGMRAFTEWEAWCDVAASKLKDKKVLMFCTGGIRCEKASAILKKRGIEDVSQLRGGIHRYLEAYPSDSGGLFRGRNFVFDHRVSTMAGATPVATETIDDEVHSRSSIVGSCVGCATPYDKLSGQRVCAVCRDFVVLCPECALCLREYHCVAHQHLSSCFFSLLDGFTSEELLGHSNELRQKVQTLISASKNGVTEGLEEDSKIPQVQRNDTRIMKRQLLRLKHRILDLQDGTVLVDKAWACGAWKKRCRSCGESLDICNATRAGDLSRCASKRNRKIEPRKRKESSVGRKRRGKRNREHTLAKNQKN